LVASAGLEPALP